jgi:hypothetical protein
LSRLGSAVFSKLADVSSLKTLESHLEPIFQILLDLKIAKNGKSKFEPRKQIYPPKSLKRQNKNRAVVQTSNFLGQSYPSKQAKPQADARTNINLIVREK